MKLGIISFAHVHAEGYANVIKELPNIELSGIAYEEDEYLGKAAANRFQTTFYSSVKKLLDSDIDGVIITSENVRHRKHVEMAAEAGKAILCEKPIATNKEDAEFIVKLCEDEGIYFQTAFPVRYNTPIREAKKALEQGAVGEILALKGTNRGVNPGSWFTDKELAGGGALMDHTVHVADILRWYTDSEVSEVYAETGNLLHNHETEDCGLITMEFETGAFASLDVSWSRNKKFPTWGDVMIEIVGTKGNLKIDAFGQRLHVYSNEQGVSWEHWGDNMDKAMIKDFTERSMAGNTSPVTAFDGMQALNVAIAANKSSTKGKSVTIS
ncbi:Gfo/Idh/MocA family protein [Alteribacillus sp. HJP-4]|uniref:Gfo/Idh/MocA family protein n=1 Tax=Alteribacillus sp. HJP-4 TaxID=2775394 RepID=UPI0035CCDF4B